MGAIGKVYANSMLVIINSRMQLGTKEMPSSMISVLKFGTAPVNNKSGVVEGHGEDLYIYTDGMTTAPARSREV